MLAALLITAALCSPASLTDGRGHADRPASTSSGLAAKAKAKSGPKGDVVLAQARLAPDPNSPDHEPSFIEQYLSFSLSPAALPQVNDAMVLSHVLGYLLPCGGLWGPVVLIDGAEFSGDVIVSWLLSSILWSVIIGVVGTITFGVGWLGYFALPYLTTTVTLNAIDRQLKTKGVSGAPKKGKPADPGTGPAQPDTPPPSYAY